jgi:hypothetical protein
MCFKAPPERLNALRSTFPSRLRTLHKCLGVPQDFAA